MLGDLVHYAIVGHSWRRLNAGDTLDVVRDKVQAAIRNDISPIICIGETKQDKDAGEAKQVIHDQLTTALMNLTSKDIEKVVLTYEPVWAISTADGIIAKPSDAQAMIRYMRNQVKELYGERAANAIRILYGGSVNEHDVRSYLELPECDGVLVGAASLNYHQFSEIVRVAHQVQTEKQ
jgi:triosephosphate isomerase